MTSALLGCPLRCRLGRGVFVAVVLGRRRLGAGAFLVVDLVVVPWCVVLAGAFVAVERRRLRRGPSSPSGVLAGAVLVAVVFLAVVLASRRRLRCGRLRRRPSLAVVFAAVAALAVVFVGRRLRRSRWLSWSRRTSVGRRRPSRPSWRRTTTALKSAPALNLGTAVFLARLRSPVRGLRTMREGRTTFSKAPKPVMATFSPLATSRVTVSRTDSSACSAAFLFPSKCPARASMS